MNDWSGDAILDVISIKFSIPCVTNLQSLKDLYQF
jgi:hypothetical protein